MLQESKHKYDIRYKNGENKLVGAFIATYEQNYSTFSGDILISSQTNVWN